MNQAQRGKGVTLQNPRTRICRKQNQQLGKGWHLQTVEDGLDKSTMSRSLSSRSQARP
jgi:hypothetical protein